MRDDQRHHAAEQARCLDAEAAEIEGAADQVVRQRHEIRGEGPERGVAQHQRQAEGAEDLRQHRPLRHVAHQAEIDHDAEGEQQHRGERDEHTSGRACSRVKAKNAAYIASMTKSPCAKFTTFIMPQISVRPEENSAYTAPISRPLTTTCSRITRLSLPYFGRHPERSGGVVASAGIRARRVLPLPLREGEDPSFLLGLCPRFDLAFGVGEGLRFHQQTLPFVTLAASAEAHDHGGALALGLGPARQQGIARPAGTQGRRARRSAGRRARRFPSPEDRRCRRSGGISMCRSTAGSPPGPAACSPVRRRVRAASPAAPGTENGSDSAPRSPASPSRVKRSAWRCGVRAT